MPELPDLVYIEKKLSSVLPGKRISRVQTKETIVLRVLLADSFETALSGCIVESVKRHGPFLNFQLSKELALIIHPMLAGRFKLTGKADKVGRGLCCTLSFDDGRALHYLDTKKMGKVYLVTQGNHGAIPRYADQGLDILSAEFTLDFFRAAIAKQRKQVRVFLMDQTILSAIGNAYADEILFNAGIHPKTFCYQLDDAAVARLYQSVGSVINWGIREVAKAAPPLEVKVRDHVKVRNRRNLPCFVCSDTIRRVGVLGYDTFFCPTCQPAQRKQFIEW